MCDRIWLAYSLTAAALLQAAIPATAAPGDTQLVSRASGLAQSGSDYSDSYGKNLVSDDGRFVVFSSIATDLVANDANGAYDIFVRDRQTGITELVSVDSSGIQGNADSYFASISSDGRYVAFSSAASNLVAGDTNDVYDIFVRDRQAGTTERVSEDSDGMQGVAASSEPAISADGRYVVFSSGSPLDGGASSGLTDIFVHDRQGGLIERVSVDSDGNVANGASLAPSISADGRFVAFASFASNLVADDTNASSDVFVRDRQSGTTERMSINQSGQGGNGESYYPTISGDGRYVAFASDANNLSSDANGATDVFVRDRHLGRTIRVSVNADNVPADAGSFEPAISGDGRYVVFASQATNLVPGYTNGGLFVRDQQTGTLDVASLDVDGVPASAFAPSISGPGLIVVFGSEAANLDAGVDDSNGVSDVFAHERAPGPTDTTPPVVSSNIDGILGANGWYLSIRSVGWNVTDPESLIITGCINQPLSFDTAGTLFTCSATSAGGTTTESVTVRRDATAPVASASASPPPNNAGWRNTNVIVSITGTDETSGINDCDPDVIVAEEGTNNDGGGFCRDFAGNTSLRASVSGIQIDKTAPTVTPERSPSANANGWNNSAVTVAFTGIDSLSGVATCSPDVVLATEGASLTASGTCLDIADNEGSATAGGINIDTTRPTAQIVTPQAGAAYGLGTAVAADFRCNDALSGVSLCVGTVADGEPIDTSTSGNKTFAVNLTDLAGNSRTVTRNYTVVAGDSTPPDIQPAVTGTLGNNGWYTSAIQLTWQVSDPESPVLQTSGCQARNVGSNTAGVTYTCTAVSQGGSNAVSITLKRDAGLPTISIATPIGGANYTVNQQVIASYSCQDAVSGIATCVGTVANGSALDTSSPGVRQFVVSATDEAGNVRTVTRQYRVR